MHSNKTGGLNASCFTNNNNKGKSADYIQSFGLALANCSQFTW